MKTSRAMASRTCGRCTLTATFMPSLRSLPLYTWQAACPQIRPRRSGLKGVSGHALLPSAVLATATGLARQAPSQTSGGCCGSADILVELLLPLVSALC